MSDDRKHWDYVIVGAGSAGCALAHALTQSGRDESVLMLEAGGSDRSPFIRFPAGQMQTLAHHAWKYRIRPDASRNAVEETWYRGRVLGGSSSINGTMYVRGAMADFDRWGEGWLAQDVLPIFREIENADRPGPLKGRSGPLYVRTVKRPHATTRAFIDAAQACGIAFNDDYNGESQEGVSYAQLSQRRGLRCSAADAFLKPLLGRKNLKVLLNAHALKIECEQGRAVAVSFSKDGKVDTAMAWNIIVCAGALESPKLLMLSGIGDPEMLASHGIGVKAALPGVGANLQEHPLVQLTFRTTVQTFNLTGGLWQKLGFLAEFLQSGEGPISNLFEGAAFLKSSEREVSPDIQLHVLPIGYLTSPAGELQFARFPSMTVLLNKSYPKSRGRVGLTSSRPEDPPSIDCRLLEDETDVETLVRGVQVVRKIMQSEPIASLIEEEVAPGPAVASVEALQGYIRRRATIAYHPIGTCRMGQGPDAVVGTDLRVHGFKNLWVADASVMPELISGNTNAACMMIGMKLGKQLPAIRSDRF